jgi:hypothetical protein
MGFCGTLAAAEDGDTKAVLSVWRRGKKEGKSLVCGNVRGVLNWGLPAL